MILSYGSAQLHKKGEDTIFIDDASDPGSSLFAVFDGHGGPQAAVLCREELCPSILASARPFSAKSVEEAFWELDATLIERGQFAGTTATVLCVDQAADGGFSCLLSWVGDSTAIVVDLLAPHSTESVVRAASTTDHNANNASESRRLLVEALVRESLEVLTDDPLTPPSVAQVEAAYAAALPCAPPLSADEAAVLTRELRRGVRLEVLEVNRFVSRRHLHAAAEMKADDVDGGARRRPLGGGGDAASGSLRPPSLSLVGVHIPSSRGAGKRGSGGGSEPDEDDVDRGTVPSEWATMESVDVRCADDECGGGAVAATQYPPRRRSRVATQLERRVASDGRSSSKPALTTYHNFDDQASAQRGASLMTTRSIGDWDAARALTPHPQSLRFAVRPACAADGGDGGGAAASPQRWAVVLASDGLWDHVTHERAAAVVRGAADPQAAADALAKLVMVGRTTPKDDTSVIVLDLNPAELPPLSRPQNPRCGSSCVVA